MCSFSNIFGIVTVDMINYVFRLLSYSRQLMLRTGENESCFKKQIPGVTNEGERSGVNTTQWGRVGPRHPLRVSGPGHINMGLYYDAPDIYLLVCDEIEPYLFWAFLHCNLESIARITNYLVILSISVNQVICVSISGKMFISMLSL